METMYPHIKVINVSLEINVVSHKSKSTLKYAQKIFILLKSISLWENMAWES